MGYEWDPVRAKRNTMLRLAIAFVATIGVTAVPLWIALKTGAI